MSFISKLVVLSFLLCLSMTQINAQASTPTCTKKKNKTVCTSTITGFNLKGKKVSEKCTLTLKGDQNNLKMKYRCKPVRLPKKKSK